MDKSNEKLPRGVWKDKDHYYLERCPKCGRENYALAVVQGICCWCGFNANEEWSEHFMAPPLRPQCPDFDSCQNKSKDHRKNGLRCVGWNGEECMIDYL